VSSFRTRGARRSLLLFALCTGLPAAGELLATGPLRLLRHRLRYRVAGVPVAVLLGWYAAIHGSLALTARVGGRLGLDGGTEREVVPVLAALTGVGLDLILDPAGLDAGLWEWNMEGRYAKGVRGANGLAGVPLVNYLGWAALVWGVARLYGQDREDTRAGPLPALVMTAPYLAAAGWALDRGRLRYLLYSSAFPVVLYAGLCWR
jgi:uncharacterized membrane protein